MRPSGIYATYRGTDYRVVTGGTDSHGRDYVGLLLDPSASADEFDDVVERATIGDRFARVPTADLERYEQVLTVGLYDGQEIWLDGIGERVPCRFLGDPAWADAHGFTGSQHDGWVGEVDFADITDVAEQVTDLRNPRSDRDTPFVS